MEGWIKLHRSLITWDYWDDHNTTRLLTYLLLSVNHQTKNWKGMEIQAGTIVTSFEKLSIATGLSVQQIRRSLTCLENDKQITRKSTNKHQTISLVKWKELQVIESKPTSKKNKTEHQNNSETTTTKEGKKERIFNTDSEFTNWFNASIEKITGKTGRFSVLSPTDKNNLEKLLNASYNQDDWDLVFKSMSVNKWVIENKAMNPSHFLRVENFNRYLGNSSSINNPFGSVPEKRSNTEQDMARLVEEERERVKSGYYDKN